MMRGGFEGLLDGTLLITVLLVASTLALSMAAPERTDPRPTGLRIAEDLRVALLRTSSPDFGYAANETWTGLPDGTTVETILRLEVHLRRVPSLDFSAANSRIASLSERLVPPGWAAQVTAEVAGSAIVRILETATVPPDRYASAWTYPSLDGSPEDVRLAVTVWVSPLR